MLSCHFFLFISCNCLVFWTLSIDCSVYLIALYLYIVLPKIFLKMLYTIYRSLYAYFVITLIEDLIKVFKRLYMVCLTHLLQV